MNANWIDKTISFLSPAAGIQRKQARMLAVQLDEAYRAYEAAAVSHRTEHWNTPFTSANSENKAAIAITRARARDVVRNNCYANRGLSVITANTVGTGILGQVNSPEEDSQDKVMAQKLWKAWAETSECDYAGRLDFYGIQALVMRTVAESGECLVLLRRRNKRLGIPYQLQVLEPDFIDTMKEERLENGGMIIQGVEFDKDGKVVAYWLFPEHPGGTVNFSMMYNYSKRIPAEFVLHIFRTDRPGQARGVTWFAPVMIRLRDFDEYEDAQLLRQKIAACFSVFIKTNEALKSPLAGAADSKNNLKVQPGLIGHLKQGQEIQTASPPTVEGYAEVASTQLHGIAAGLGIPHAALTGNLSEVNFSSAKIGFTEFHRNIEMWRWQMLIPQLCVPVWSLFKSSLIMQGVNTSSLFISWTPPRREMIDPTKEVPAAIAAIRGGLKTLSEVIRENGDDPVEHLYEIARDNKLTDKLGLVLDSDPRQVTQSGAYQVDSSESEKKDGGVAA